MKTTLIHKDLLILKLEIYIFYHLHIILDDLLFFPFYLINIVEK